MKYIKMGLLFLLFPLSAYSRDVNEIPTIMLGAGVGMSRIVQNVDGADHNLRFGLIGTGAYSPIEKWFFGFDIFTFSPYDSVRATNYMFTTSYKASKFNFGLLSGLQTANDARANSIDVDPLTGKLLLRNSNAFSYGLKLSYDKIINTNRDDFNYSVSPVLYIIKSAGDMNYNEILLTLEFRLWGY